MPRKLSDASKAAIADGGFSEVGQSVIKATDSPAMAAAFPDTADDVHASDPDAAADFLVVSRDLESKALDKYLKLKRTIGAQLAKAESDYVTHRDRTLRLFSVVTNGLPPESQPSKGGDDRSVQ